MNTGIRFMTAGTLALQDDKTDVDNEGAAWDGDEDEDATHYSTNRK